MQKGENRARSGLDPTSPLRTPERQTCRFSLQMGQNWDSRDPQGPSSTPELGAECPGCDLTYLQLRILEVSREAVGAAGVLDHIEAEDPVDLLDELLR